MNYYFWPIIIYKIKVLKFKEYYQYKKCLTTYIHFFFLEKAQSQSYRFNSCTGLAV